MSRKRTLHFKTNVQLKSIIGKDLINDDNIAILELVKNSFDADAKEVIVKYLNLKDNDDEYVNGFSNKTSRLIIQDDGVGMTEQDVENKWLNIAYSEKKTVQKQHNRRMAGAKGVGRFSCDRLGKHLNLYTKTKNDRDYFKLSINWKEFEIEDEDKEIQSINLSSEIISASEMKQLGFNDFHNGVLLEIIKLRSTWAYQIFQDEKIIKWDVNKFVTLKQYLEKLINPNQAFTKDDFGIYVEAPEFLNENNDLDKSQQFIGQVKNRIFEKLDFKSTSIECETINNGHLIQTVLRDKGQTIFRILEANPFSENIKNAKVTIYFLNPYTKSFFTKQTGIRSIDYGSIFLFMNGFRVSPYGQPGNDWLGLDQRKGQGQRRYLGVRDVVGRIEIQDDNNDFQIITSREGIVRNDNYKALVNQSRNNSFFFKTFRRLERYVVDGLDWDKAPSNINLSSIHNKIVSGETLEDELTYSEDNKTKQLRVYSSIHSIISVKTDDVKELYINENLISQKIVEEKEKSQQEFEKLLDDFENQKIDSETLNRILKNRAKHNKELERELKNFEKYSTDEATTKALLELQNYKKTIEEQNRLITQLRNKLKSLEDEAAKAAERAAQAQSEIDKIKTELTEAKSQNLFLKSIKSKDLEEVLNLMHHIGISTGTIQNYIKGAVFKIDNKLEFEEGELKNIFSKLNYELNKIYSISRFSTKANFKVESKDSKLDLISFTEEYLLNIVKPFLPKKISLTVIENDENTSFETKFKPLELIIVIDNLISNSRKAFNRLESSLDKKNYNHKIEVEISVLNEETLEILFRDNGDGIPDTNKNKIFDYGFTTTEGSGLGVSTRKRINRKNWWKN